MADRVSKETRSEIMKSVKSKRTKIEETLSKELWKHGFRFRRNVKGLLGTPDFALKTKKIVIFVDSCFWHGCMEHCKMPKSNVEFWNEKINRNKKRDLKVTQHYVSGGWTILRIWEHSIKSDLPACIKNIDKVYNSSKSVLSCKLPEVRII